MPLIQVFSTKMTLGGFYVFLLYDVDRALDLLDGEGYLLMRGGFRLREGLFDQGEPRNYIHT